MEQAAFDIRLFDHPNEWRHIRMEVFQKEQGFQNEFDALDAQALHLCAYHNEEAIGCLRLYSEDPTKKHWHLGRLAVLAPWRHLHVATTLLQAAKQLLTEAGASTITLDAQSHLQAFYERSGYSVCGPTFHEEHVLHVPMRTCLGEPRTC